jgi:hypothetical protein
LGCIVYGERIHLENDTIKAAWTVKNAAKPLFPNHTERRAAGLILWRDLGDARSAVAYLESGPLRDPPAVVELDQLYAELGLMAERAALLARPSQHRFVIGRRTDLALALGQPVETLRLLIDTPWPREHQRYTRVNMIYNRLNPGVHIVEVSPPEAK